MHICVLQSETSVPWFSESGVLINNTHDLKVADRARKLAVVADKVLDYLGGLTSYYTLE